MRTTAVSAFARLAACVAAAAFLVARVEGQNLPSQGGFPSPLGLAGPTDDGPKLKVEASFAPAIGGEAAQLIVTAKLEPGWHTYSITQPPGGPTRTKITVPDSPQYKVLGPFQPTTAPHAHPEAAFGGVMVEEYEGTVTWVAPLEIASGVDPATLTISGKVVAQLCDARGCLAPESFPFEAHAGPRVIVPADAPAQAAPPTAEPGSAKPSEASVPAPQAFDPARIVVANAPRNVSLGWAMLNGFLGGIILNFMPCVLPVIGLKVLSFVSQSGESRGRVLLLNLVYSAGIMAVFLVLASLAAFASWSWGQQATYASFNITLATVVFVFGLSFLGVWEIPIPGFVGRGAVAEAADREGYSGAFFKGCVTTILAVPCSGPFLGAALTWASGQPAYLIYGVFICIGLGMAFPYLLLGAFPGLLRALPRPGAWMETFKHIMGFVLMGTVIFLLSLVPIRYVVPTVALMFGLWAACWWVGRIPLTAPTSRQLVAWAQAAVFALAIGWISFGWLSDEMESRFMRAVDNAIAQRVGGGAGRDTKAPDPADSNRLPWKPFTPATLAQLTSEGRTVMVDFTADWCLTCQAVEKAVLDVSSTKEFVEQNGVVPLVADFTDGSAEVADMLERLGSKQIPKLAIFPANDPNRPIVLDGVYTQAQLFEALRKAGPSRTAAVRPAQTVAAH